MGGSGFRHAFGFGPDGAFFLVTANFFFETGFATSEALETPVRRTLGLAVTGGAWLCSDSGSAYFDFPAFAEFFLFSLADLVDDLLDALEDLRSVWDEESLGLSLLSISFTFIEMSPFVFLPWRMTAG